MPEIKLKRLPDRTPVKLSLSIDPSLSQAIADYFDFYRETYGDAVAPADLIPAMIEAFLASDRAFARRGR